MASLANNPQSNRPPRILGLKEVMFLTGYSRSKIYRLDKRGVLLRAKQVEGSPSAGWLEDSVYAHIESRRPDPIDPLENIHSGQTKTSKGPALVRHKGDEETTTNFSQTRVQLSKAKGAKSGGTSADLQLTSMTVMGGKVYLHAPTGNLFLEIGKAPALLAGINITGDDGNV